MFYGKHDYKRKAAGIYNAGDDKLLKLMYAVAKEYSETEELCVMLFESVTFKFEQLLL